MTYLKIGEEIKKMSFLKVADAIKRIRWELRMSQSELAKEIRCSQITISSYEIGKRSPSYRTLKKLEEFVKKTNLDIHFC